MAFHLTCFFGYGVCFSPFLDFDIKGILELEVSWVVKLHVMLISAESLVAIYLFGSQSDESANFLTKMLVQTLYFGWFFVFLSGVVLLFVRLQVSRFRKGQVERDEGDCNVEFTDGGLKDDNMAANKILSGEGVLLSPGMY